MKRIASGLIFSAIALAPLAAQAVPHGKPGLWTVVSTMKMANMPDMPPEVLAMMKKRGMPGMGQPVTTQMCMTQQDVAAGEAMKDKRPDCTTKILSQTATSATTEIMCHGDMNGTAHSQINWRGDGHYEGSYSFKGTMHGQSNEMSTSYTGDFVRADCGAVKPYSAGAMAH